MFIPSKYTKLLAYNISRENKDAIYKIIYTLNTLLFHEDEILQKYVDRRRNFYK